MFCSQCGTQAAGKFCTHCGAKLVADPPVSLATSVDVAAILRIPEVQQAIERHAALAKKRIAGETYLAVAEKLMPVGVPLVKLAGFIQPLYAKWGIGAGTRREELISAPIGFVIVRAVCSLARQGQPLKSVQQAEDGCRIEAELPSDLLALKGEVVITLCRQGSGTAATCEARSPGQVVDWGKSKRCIERLLGDLRRRDEFFREAA